MNNIKIRDKLLIVYGAVILISLWFSSYFTSVKSLEYIKDEIASASSKQLSQSNKDIDSIITSYNKIFYSMIINRELQKLLSVNYENFSDWYDNMLKIKDIIHTATSVYQYIPAVKVFPFNNSIPLDNIIFMDRKKIINESWYNQTLNAEREKFKWHKPFYREENGGKVSVIVATMVLQDQFSGKDLAIISCEFDIDRLLSSLLNNQVGKGNMVLLLENDGNIIFGNSPETVETNAGSLVFLSKVKLGGSGYYMSDIEGVKSIIIYDSSNKMGWTLCNTITLREFQSKFAYIRNYTWIIFLVCLFFGLLITYLYSLSISNRIDILMRSMVKAGNGDLNVDPGLSGKDEIGKISGIFVSMIHEIKCLMTQNINYEKIKHKLEIKSLQEQIKPHFLYNTLSAIKNLALDIEANDISAIIENLAVFYKISLNQGQDFISVLEEIRLTRTYVDILKYSYKNKFDMNYDIDDEVYGYYTPKIIIQPFVENSVFHGSGKKAGVPCKIRLIAKKMENRLIFIIEDDGVGIEKNRIKEIMNSQGEGFAIKNTDNRIILCCGDGYGVDIKSEPDSGTKVTINLPLITSKDRFQ